MEALTGFIFPPIYSAIYIDTLKTFPGTIYFFSAALFLVTIATFMWVLNMFLYFVDLILLFVTVSYTYRTRNVSAKRRKTKTTKSQRMATGQRLWKHHIFSILLDINKVFFKYKLVFDIYYSIFILLRI